MSISAERRAGLARLYTALVPGKLSTGYFDGSVSGSWNVAMESMLDHVDAWRRNDVDRAREIWDSGLSVLQDWIYSDRSRQHVRYKLGAQLRGLIAHAEMRPPMPPPMPDEIKTMQEPGDG